MIAQLDRGLIAIALAGGFAIALPAWLLWPAPVELPVTRDTRLTPLRVIPVPSFSQVLDRPLFAADRRQPAPPPAEGAAPAVPVAPPAPPPELVGTIAGRTASVALVRNAAGETVRVHVGDIIDGWQVRAIGDRFIVVEQGQRRETSRLDFRKTAGPTASGLPDQTGGVPSPITTPPVATEPNPRGIL